MNSIHCICTYRSRYFTLLLLLLYTVGVYDYIDRARGFLLLTVTYTFSQRKIGHEVFSYHIRQQKTLLTFNSDFVSTDAVFHEKGLKAHMKLEPWVK